MKGEFIISLDFELHWGIFDKVNFEENKRYFENTRAAIPEMLTLFKAYNVEVTWATVGMLFNSNLTDWSKNKPVLKPHYNNEALSAYHWTNSNKSSLEQTGLGHFAPELVSLIANTKGQEMASHTYAHYYCLDKGQTLNDFNADAKQFSALAKTKGLELTSLVFPRNQFNKEYLEVCEKNGLKIVRTNPDNWCWKHSASYGIFQKIARTLDCYFPVFKSTYKKETILKQKGVVLLPASRFLKPFSAYTILNKLRLNRIKKEMTYAAKKGEFYHLWWHPHNFGNHPFEAIKDLKSILEHYVYLNKTYKMNSSNMRNIYNTYFSANEK